jgi:hypothetical protein
MLYFAALPLSKTIKSKGFLGISRMLPNTAAAPEKGFGKIAFLIGKYSLKQPR